MYGNAWNGFSGAVLGPLDEYSKKLCTIVVLRLGYNPSMFCHISRQYPRNPNQKITKCRFCPFWRRFQLFGLAIAGIIMRRDKTSLSFSPDTCLKQYVRAFENSFNELGYRDVSAGLWGRNQEKTVRFEERIWKLGRKMPPLPNFSAFTRLRF